MIRINFAGLNQILTFDGEVLEVFYGTRSARAHIAHIKSIEVRTDRKENQELRIETKSGPFAVFQIEQGVVSAVNELIAEVKSAMATFSM